MTAIEEIKIFENPQDLDICHYCDSAAKYRIKGMHENCNMCGNEILICRPCLYDLGGDIREILYRVYDKQIREII